MPRAVEQMCMTVFINFYSNDLDLVCQSCAMVKRKTNHKEGKKKFPCHFFLFALIEIIIKILIGTDSLEINCWIRV